MIQSFAQLQRLLHPHHGLNWTAYFVGHNTLHVLYRAIAKLLNRYESLRDRVLSGNGENKKNVHLTILNSVFLNPIVLQYFNVHFPTEVVVDAGPCGLAGLLTQRSDNGDTIIVAIASRSLSDIEKHYSQTEKECLAVVWACEHFNIYLVGCNNFSVITDHKPLEGILNNPTSHPTARLQRMCL